MSGMARFMRNQKAVRKAQVKRAQMMDKKGGHRTMDERLEHISKPTAWLLCGLFCLVFWALVIGAFFL